MDFVDQNKVLVSIVTTVRTNVYKKESILPTKMILLSRICEIHKPLFCYMVL